MTFSPSKLPKRLRVALVLTCAVLLLGAIGAIFWMQDVRYSQPTPRPVVLVEVPLGAKPDLPKSLVASGKTGAPFTLLHFFNFDCPCSRFNVEHARDLARKTKGVVRFVALVQTDETSPEARARLQQRAHDLLPEFETVLDDGGKAAAACGVYSTPQAVILAAGGELLFRGNYNTSRYCVDASTEFARIALDAVISGRPVPPMPTEASQAYGCELPENASVTSAAAPASTSVTKL